MKKKNIVIIVGVIIVILSIGVYFTINYFLNKDLTAEEENQEIVDTYGYIEEENVANLVAKFNTEVMASSLNYPASPEYLIEEAGVYWYGLYEDINLYIEPLDYTSTQENDIVDISAINFPKDSKNQEMALQFAKQLVKANNNTLTDLEINELLKEAKEVSKDKGVASNGKGLTVALAENDTTYEYQVVRLYK